jgi:hypothetical protein
MGFDSSSVLVMYSKEFEANGLPWRVETSKSIFYVKHVEIQVPSRTITRRNASPAYVLHCEGQVQFNSEQQQVTIVSIR